MSDLRTSRIVSCAITPCACATRTRLRTRAIALAAFVVATACTAGDEGREPPPPITPTTDQARPDDSPPAVHQPDSHFTPRAETITDTLFIEGMPEIMLSRLFHTSRHAAVPFSTYVPEGIHAGIEGNADTLAVRFSAAFNGMPHPSAYMHVRFYPADATQREALATAFALLRSRVPAGEESQPTEAPPWADEAYAFTYRGDGNVLHVGRIIIASHGGRFFHVLTHYPAEFGDGLGPRFARILDKWRWDDTGTMLTE